MPAQTKHDNFTKDLVDGIHAFGTHTFKALLTNTAPNTSTHDEKADLTEITPGNGYSAGGPTITMSTSTSSGTAKVTATDATITASGGSIGPFRYVTLYNDTSTGDRLISTIDYGSSITLAAGESFTIDFDGSAGLLTI